MAKPTGRPNGRPKAEPIHEYIVQTGELGAVVGKTGRWIRELTHQGVLIQIERGKYVLGDSVQRYIEYMIGSSKEDNSRTKHLSEKAEHERLKKEKVALELEKMRGDLHSTKEVEALVSDMILTTKAKLQALPAQLAPKLEGEPASVIEKEIRREINAVLHALANMELRAGED